MEIKREFKSYDNRHKISIIHIKDENFCYMRIEEYDIENKKTFCYMFKEVMEYLKENRIENIKQYLTNDIVDKFKKSEIIRINEEESIVISNIKYIALEVYIGLYIIDSKYIYEIEE